MSDDELVGSLCALGKRAHLVLANGSITKKTNETPEEARKRDENETARKKLEDVGVAWTQTLVLERRGLMSEAVAELRNALRLQPDLEEVKRDFSF